MKAEDCTGFHTTVTRLRLVFLVGGVKLDTELLLLRITTDISSPDTEILTFAAVDGQEDIMHVLYLFAQAAVVMVDAQVRTNVHVTVVTMEINANMISTSVLLDHVIRIVETYLVHTLALAELVSRKRIRAVQPIDLAQM